MTTDIPKSITAPDKVETSIGTLEYFDGVPQPQTVETVYDYLDRSRAVQVFLNSIPAMSVATLRDGQASVGADTCNKICIWDSLMDSKSLLLTGNTSTMYAVGFLDLQQDGPSVIELPPGMLGILDDMEFHYMSDLGVAGPDKGKGGKPPAGSKVSVDNLQDQITYQRAFEAVVWSMPAVAKYGLQRHALRRPESARWLRE